MISVAIWRRGSSSEESCGSKAMLTAIDAWRSCAVAAQVAASTWADGEALAALRARRLSELLARCARSPLYRRLLRGAICPGCGCNSCRSCAT